MSTIPARNYAKSFMHLHHVIHKRILLILILKIKKKSKVHKDLVTFPGYIVQLYQSLEHKLKSVSKPYILNH